MAIVRALMAPIVPRLTCALLLLSTVAACKSTKQKVEETVLEDQTGNKIKLTEGGLVMTTDAGTFALGAGSKVPDDFPKTVPVYPGARVNMAGRSPGLNGKMAWTLSLESDDDAGKVGDFYKSKMASFTLASDLDMAGTRMLVWQSAQNDVTLMAGPGNTGGTAFTLTVSAK